MSKAASSKPSWSPRYAPVSCPRALVFGVLSLPTVDAAPFSDCGPSLDVFVAEPRGLHGSLWALHCARGPGEDRDARGARADRRPPRSFLSGPIVHRVISPEVFPSKYGCLNVLFEMLLKVKDIIDQRVLSFLT